jgi:hypothetical protein
MYIYFTEFVQICALEWNYGVAVRMKDMHSKIIKLLQIFLMLSNTVKQFISRKLKSVWGINCSVLPLIHSDLDTDSM